MIGRELRPLEVETQVTRFGSALAFWWKANDYAVSEPQHRIELNDGMDEMDYCGQAMIQECGNQ